LKILIDIGHPAHVHYFKNFIRIMKARGHEFLIIAKNRNIVHELLEHYSISYIPRKDYNQSITGKLLRIPFTDLFVLFHVIKFRPDILLGFAGTHIAHAGFILNLPRIVLDDTEHARLSHASYKLFASVILTPSCFTKDFGKKHLRFNGYMELCYLHPNYFTPNTSILNLLGVKKNEKYIIMRFVSWNASHDLGHSGLSKETKYKAVKELSKYAKVFISAEGDLPNDLIKYQIKIPSDRMHDALANASLLFGESSTMASESACLGIPAIYHDNIGRGYTDEEENEYGLVFNYSESLEDQKRSLQKAIELLKSQNCDRKYVNNRNKLLADKIDVTAFMVWFVENYPQSVIMRNDPTFYG
jgi:uncharacterized protein